MLKAAEAQFGLGTSSNVPIRTITKVRYELEDLENEIDEWRYKVERGSVARDWIQRYNLVLREVVAHVGDEAPDPIVLPESLFDEKKRLIAAGRQRLISGVGRAKAALDSGTSHATDDEVPGRSVSSDAGDLRPRLRSIVEPLLLNGRGHEAVERASMDLARRVRDLTGLECDDSSLMETALAPGSPRLLIDSLATATESIERQGTMEIATGLLLVAQSLATPSKSTYDENDIRDLLAIVSFIHRRLDGARFPPETNTRES